MNERIEPDKPKKVATGPEKRPAPDATPVLVRPYSPPIQGAAAAIPRTRKVLLAGISGGLGTLVMRRLLASDGRYEITGLARTDLEDSLRSKVEFVKCELTQNRAEDVFRRGDIDTVVHLAFEDDPRIAGPNRYKTNVLGTMRLLDWAERYGVRKVVVVSSATVYGALQDNPTLLTEDFPTRADLAYAGIRDRVEADRYAVAWMWKYPEIETVILRPVHVLGKNVSGPFKHYITLKYVPVLLGFDPMMQVVHEDDAARAIHLAVEREVSGVFNVTGPGAIPLREILREVGAEVVPIPHLGGLQALQALYRLGLVPFPAPTADFVKYPMVVSGERAARELGYVPEIPLRDAIRSVRRD